MSRSLATADEYPLHGLRVIEFGWVLAGTVPGMILADLGAEVIKIESTQRLDLNRQGPPVVGDVTGPEQNPRFHNLNRGKLSVTVNLREARGRELVLRLAEVSDVVVENFSPGVLDRLGLGYETLAKRRSDLIMASISAVGQDGPWADTRGYAITISALSGIASLIGYDGESPVGDHFMYADVAAALHATLGILAALHERGESGSGYYLDVSMLESAVAVMGEAMMHALVSGSGLSPRGIVDGSAAPYGIYRCAGLDDWIAIAVETEHEWGVLCQAMERPQLACDPRFVDMFQRTRNRRSLDRMLESWTCAQDKFELSSRLQEAGIAATPVLNLEEHLQDPGLREAELYQSVHHPIVGEEEIVRSPWSSPGGFGGIRGRAPLLGEHTEDVARRILGYSNEEIAALARDGVLV